MKRSVPWAEVIAKRLGAEVLERSDPKMLQRYGVETIAQVAFRPPAVLGELPQRVLSAAEFLRLLAEVLSRERVSISLAREPEEVAKALTEGVRILGGERPEVQGLGDVLSATLQEKPSLLDITAAGVLSAEAQEASVAFKTRFEKALERAEELATSCLVKIWCQGEIKGEIKEWVGSGFVFNGSDRPLVMTARHVVEDAQSIYLESRDGSRVQAMVVATADGYDLAILRALEETSCTPCKVTLKTPNQLRGHQVLLIGFHAAGITPKIQIKDACGSLARVVSFAPLRRVHFRDGWTQPCLVMVVGPEQETVREGMSGGPIVDLETGQAEIVAVVTGAQAELIHQPYPVPDSPESLPVAEYAFGTLIQNAVGSSPELYRYFWHKGRSKDYRDGEQIHDRYYIPDQ